MRFWGISTEQYRDQVIDSFNNIIDEKEMLAKLQEWKDRLRAEEADFLRRRGQTTKADSCKP